MLNTKFEEGDLWAESALETVFVVPQAAPAFPGVYHGAGENGACGALLPTVSIQGLLSLETYNPVLSERAAEWVNW